MKIACDVQDNSKDMNPYKDLDDSSFTAPHLAYEDIATKLLKDNYFLTALELHTELVESGKELPQLREFFSNPGNFEQHVSRAQEFGSMHRTPSQATLDSLDTARYSEDGGGDRAGSGGDVAVLEFELRKARETINSLRANLTQFADGESGLDNNPKDKSNQRALKPHEKRALNFLINEYLLLQDYKLTSITFSDENPDQDFEDWDDVGLILPRPSGLVSLFWGTSNMNVPMSDASTEMCWETVDVECQTNDEEVCVSCQSHATTDANWSHEVLVQAEEIELLKQKIIALETEKLNFQKLYDAAIVSLNSLTSPGSDSKGLDLNIPESKLQLLRNKLEEDNQPLPCTATENHYGSGHSTHSATPEQFEMIESDKTMAKKDSSTASSLDPSAGCADTPHRRGSVATLDDTLSINDGGEWTRVPYENAGVEGSREMWIDSGLPNTLKVSILRWCVETLDISEPLSSDLLTELVNSEKPITLPGLLELVADTLPRIIPHTLVSRRCEAAALLACCVHLLASDVTRRTRLLQTLLTLLKKPDAQETRCICEAACLIVKWGGSGEVLSSIAELITSRSSERKLLASQICVSIAPYVSIELCTSLLLSLVILMCESNETEVRSLGLKAACLICPVGEHKYGQLESLMFGFLKDPVEKNVKDTVNIFVPVLARTALIAGKFSTDLCSKILTNLNKLCTEKEWRGALLHLDILRVLVLAKLAFVVNVQIVREVNHCDMEIMNYQEVPLENEPENFLDIQCYVVDNNVDVKALAGAMNSLIKDKPDVRWPELTWFVNITKQILEIATNSKSLNQPNVYSSLISLFSRYVDSFEVHFTTHVLKPIFMEIITDLEQKMDKLHAINVDSTVVVGIYFVTVLPALEDVDEIGEFVQKWIMYSSIRGLPVNVLSVPLQWVAKNKPDLLDVYLQHLREFAAHSVSNASGAAARVLVAGLVAAAGAGAQALPAVTALLHDEDTSVREAAIPAWAAQHRHTSGPQRERSWAALEQALAAPGAGEAARAADALASLLGTPGRGGDDTAIQLLCSLCSTAPLTADSAAALTAALTQATHHAPEHPLLPPALRKLEEGVQAPGLAQYKSSIEALIHNVVGMTPSREVTSSRDAKPTTSNLLAAQEAVGRRVTQMFQQSKTNMNIPNIFKKKT
ncbi:RAB11-binding protein RELCH homolog [Plutella xylostella]|uniref:RAB11-binding protein RELCH homolog n=1 Tax=Plutella xylostella TaxID=51655 RepID=UPI0020330EC0|nr:RAB11-binding protein RELCH homolog [Plutella xylostella]